MKVFKRTEPLLIEVGNKELKEVDVFKYLGSVLTVYDYCTREIKTRIGMNKETFNGKISLFKSKPSTELKKKFVN